MGSPRVPKGPKPPTTEDMDNPDITQRVKTRWTDKRELITKLLDDFMELSRLSAKYELSMSWLTKKRYKRELDHVRMNIIIVLEKLL